MQSFIRLPRNIVDLPEISETVSVFGALCNQPSQYILEPDRKSRNIIHIDNVFLLYWIDPSVFIQQ